jgi:hypothetical protein
MNLKRMLMLPRTTMMETAMLFRHAHMLKSSDMQELMSFADLEPGVVLQVLLFLDSPAVFRMRRCNRALAQLFSNGAYTHCCDLLRGTSVSPGSHTAKGGIWLHALVPEDVLSQYVRFCSTTELATDLEFKDIAAVEGLQKATSLSKSIAIGGNLVDKDQQINLGYVTRHGRSVHLNDPLQGPFLDNFMNNGQRFLGSWTFNPECVRSMLSGKELGQVYSSYVVEFRAMLSCQNGFEGQIGVQSQDSITFGVQLMLSRAALDRFVLSWRPCFTTAALPEEHMDSFDVHLHGHVADPFVFPLGYEGTISASSPTRTHINGDVPVELTLSLAEITKLLEHDCLNCALNIQCYHENHAIAVTPTTRSRSHTQGKIVRSESGRWASKLLDLVHLHQRLSSQN